jgi:hypothetical protein
MRRPSKLTQLSRQLDSLQDQIHALVRNRSYHHLDDHGDRTAPARGVKPEDDYDEDLTGEDRCDDDDDDDDSEMEETRNRRRRTRNRHRHDDDEDQECECGDPDCDGECEDSVENRGLLPIPGKVRQRRRGNWINQNVAADYLDIPTLNWSADLTNAKAEGSNADCFDGATPSTEQFYGGTRFGPQLGGESPGLAGGSGSGSTYPRAGGRVAGMAGGAGYAGKPSDLGSQYDDYWAKKPPQVAKPQGANLGFKQLSQEEENEILEERRRRLGLDTGGESGDDVLEIPTTVADIVRERHQFRSQARYAPPQRGEGPIWDWEPGQAGK